MSSRRHLIVQLLIGFLGGWLALVSAHQDPCHRLHSCPSDRNTSVCGNRGHCDQCPDNQYCLGTKPRPAASSPSAPTPPAPIPAQPSSPRGMTVCFTPGGTCTDLIVQTRAEAKRSVLVQAYSFTSAPIAKALLEAHKRGVQV
jgi:phosphatidylserine/phosphatidylglycerophosphate/cardiolipin synthase-like enzyme